MSDERVTSVLSITSAASTFVLSTLPILQWIAVIIAIVSGLLSIHKHLKAGKNETQG